MIFLYRYCKKRFGYGNKLVFLCFINRLYVIIYLGWVFFLLSSLLIVFIINCFLFLFE